jgi:hypothetical protein
MFFVLPGFQTRLVLIGEQEVNGRWVNHNQTEFAQFSPLDGDAVHRMVERVRSGALQSTCQQQTPHFDGDVYRDKTSLQGVTSTQT